MGSGKNLIAESFELVHTTASGLLHDVTCLPGLTHLQASGISLHCAGMCLHVQFACLYYPHSYSNPILNVAPRVFFSRRWLTSNVISPQVCERQGTRQEILLALCTTRHFGFQRTAASSKRASNTRYPRLEMRPRV